MAGTAEKTEVRSRYEESVRVDWGWHPIDGGWKLDVSLDRSNPHRRLRSYKR